MNQNVAFQPFGLHGRPLAWIFLFLVACGSFFINLGLSDVVDVNEGQRLLPALEMIEHGDWIVPRLDGAVYINKPPLVYWIFGAAFKINGQATPLAARIPTAFASLLAVLLVVLIGRRHQSEAAGFFAGLFLATNQYFHHKAHNAELDPFLVVALLLTIYCYWRANEEPTRRWIRWGLLSALAAGGAFLLKGPVFLPFLLAALVAAWLAIRPGWSRLLTSTLLVIVVALLIAAPWCILLIERLGFAGVWGILHRESLTRLVHSTRINSGPIYYYFAHVSVSFLPWTWLLLFWGVRRFKDFRSTHSSAFYCFAAWFTLGSFIIFSLIKGKETEYLLPVYPFLALLSGAVMDWLIQPESADLPQWRGAKWLLIGLCFAGFLAPAALLNPAAGQWLKMSWSITGMLFGGALAAASTLALLLRGSRRALAVMAFALAFSLLDAAVADALKIRANQERSARPLALALAQEAAQGTRIYRWIKDRPHDVWYVRNASQPLESPESLRELLKAPGKPIGVLARKKDIKKLARKYQDEIIFVPDAHLQAIGLTFATIHPKASEPGNRPAPVRSPEAIK